jgi:hypothetical protein
MFPRQGNRADSAEACGLNYMEILGHMKFSGMEKLQRMRGCQKNRQDQAVSCKMGKKPLATARLTIELMKAELK